MRTLLGKLISASDRFYFFETDDGQTLPIVWEGSDPLPPFERFIALSIPDEPWDDGRYVVDNTGHYWTYAEPHHPDVVVVEAAPLNGPEKKNIALYWQHRPGTAKEDEIEDMTKAAFEIQRFYQKYARDKWDVECRAFWFKEYTGSPNPPYYGLQEILQEVDLGDFTPDIHHVRSHWYNSSYCGLGNLYGDKSCTYDGGNCGLHTYLHEIGHNLGLRHANKDGEEYMDRSCIMGRGASIHGINAYHLRKLKLYDSRERLDINDSTEFLLAPVELPWHCLHPDQYQHAVLYRDGHEWYELSLRKDRGWPWSPKESEDKLYVHTKTPEGKSDLVDIISPVNNPSRLLPNGVTVNYADYGNEAASIQVWYPAKPPGAAIPLPADLPTRLPGTEPHPMHSGLWYDKRYHGQGLDIQIKGNRVVGYWYTFNQKQGKYGDSEQRWYFFEGKVGDNSMPVFTTENGTFDNPTLRVVREIGHVQLSFTAHDRGIMIFNTTEHGNGCMYLDVIDWGVIYGIWYDPARDGAGFTIQHPENAPASPDVVVYWYTYDNTSEQVWYLCQGTEDNLTIYHVTGGHWCDYHEVDIQPVGHGSILPAGGGKMKFTYNFQGGQGGSFTLQELF
jgi:hypothetical protein